ncbi:major facilitator superfamily domain-containing protein, partial [Pisolithus marmoratus]
MYLAQGIGLLIGSVFWGVGSDVWGRRWSFNFTLLITGTFAIAAAGSSDYNSLCMFMALWSIGVGGNFPVGSAVLLECFPASHQYLLTVLSIWWAVGQLIGALVVWPLISHYSCTITMDTCVSSLNKGWRYYLFTMGGVTLVMWILRFFVFNLQESPKFLMSRGRDEEAVAAVHRVAAFNGKISNLTIEHLEEAEKLFGSVQGQAHTSRVKLLFGTRKLAYSTCILVALWALIGLAFPLYNDVVTYRNDIISSAISVPGGLMAGYLVELPILGRRGTLSIFTALTGVFVFASAFSGTSNSYLAWDCVCRYTSTVMYGVLYALTPELFPTRTRGTGSAIVAAANHICGLMTLIIRIYIFYTFQMWLPEGIFVIAGLTALLLPFEPRGKASL